MSSNIAPAMPHDTHDCCPSHMKRHLQYAEQQASPSNITKYRAFHAWGPKSKRNLPKTVEASLTMRGLFDHDPNMKLQN